MIHSGQKPRWWTELAWRLYFCLPGLVDDILKWRYPYILPFKTLRIPIAILRGPTRLDGHPGTMLVAGAENNFDYLIHNFFEDKYQTETIGKVPLWTLPLTLKRLRTSADLTIARVDRFSSRLFFGADYMAVPEFVGSTLKVPEDVEKLARGNPSLKTDLRNVRRSGLTSEVTHAEDDFDLFYYKMYVPFTLKRHGRQAVVKDIYRIRRIFNKGGLLWIRQYGRPIAGIIFEQSNQILRLFILGTMDGEWTLVKAGTIAALYIFSIEHAKKLGCRLVDFGGCRPSLNDGLLRYKRKWGMSLINKNDNYYEFMLYWNHLNVPVTSFLSRAPLIFRNNHELSAIYIIDHNEPVTQSMVTEIHRSVWIPGLQQLNIVSTSGWHPDISSPPQTHLLDATTVRNCDPSTLLAICNQLQRLE